MCRAPRRSQRLLRLVVRASLPFLPQLHTPDQDLWFVRNVMFAQCELWVVETNDMFEWARG
jgi:hypothetical protein